MENPGVNCLCHYYEYTIGPFVNLSDLPNAEAEKVLDNIRSARDTFASRRSPDYLAIRFELEQKARQLFIERGGVPVRRVPHYMTLGECPWLKSWYKDGRELNIPISEFNLKSVSFTYGDLFPTMRYNDGKVYRNQIYTYDGIMKVIEEFGLPQIWNAKGNLGPERYIEAQIWDDGPLKKYL